jgi:hypothetical protein
MAGTFTVSGSAASLLTGSKTIGPITFTGSATIGEVLDLTLQSGDNTIAIPTGATAVLIVPPASNAVALKVRSSLNSGDAGLPIHVTAPFLYCFPGTAPTTLIINAASLTTGLTELSFV